MFLARSQMSLIQMAEIQPEISEAKDHWELGWYVMVVRECRPKAKRLFSLVLKQQDGEVG
jgi:hypothetical protein